MVLPAENEIHRLLTEFQLGNANRESIWSAYTDRIARFDPLVRAYVDWNRNPVAPKVGEEDQCE